MNKRLVSASVALCVIACTIVIFCLVFDERTKLFYINVVTTCVCEAILLANIPLLSSARLLTFKNAATSYVLDAYAVAMFLWTAGCSLFLPGDGDLTVLYVGMLVLTACCAVAAGVTAVGGGVVEDGQARLDAAAERKRGCAASLAGYRLEAEALLAADASEWKETTLRSLAAALDKVEAMPSAKLERGGAFVAEVCRRLDDIKALLASAAADGGNEAAKAEATREISLLDNYVTTVKATL